MPPNFRPPPIDGVNPSRLQLPVGPWATVLEALCAHFPQVLPSVWLDRMARQRVLDTDGVPIGPGSKHCRGLRIFYYREVPDELAIAGQERVLHVDEHLVVADKPHGLPVTPNGRYVGQTLLARLIRRLDNPNLTPLHRLDRDTAGLVLFSAKPETRGDYHALFSKQLIAKRYQALAPALPDQLWPQIRRSRIVRGQPFFRMQEVAGTPNSETRIEVMERGERLWRYALFPRTGRKHQLRVHMAALGAPIFGDSLYPWTPGESVANEPEQSETLQLLAQGLSFVDPLSGDARSFESTFSLDLERISSAQARARSELA